MSDFPKIPYYDLQLEAREGRLPVCIGRGDEMGRLSRIISRNINHHAFVVGPNGLGKTTFLYGWAHTVKNHPALADFAVVLLESSTLQKISVLTPTLLGFYLEAFSGLENTIIVIDDFGDVLANQPSALQNWQLLLKPLFENSSVRVVAGIKPEQLEWLKNSGTHVVGSFEQLVLNKQSPQELLDIIKSAGIKITKESHTVVPEESYKTIVQFCERFPTLGELPKAAIELLDECIAEALVTPGIEGEKKDSPKQVTSAIIEKVISEKTGVPLNKLNRNEKDKLRNLENMLNNNIIGQQKALGTIVSIVQRARLGLRNPNRPLGSFLLLGPSGVGKTETAKILAGELFGEQQSFLRIDMSEFSEAHTVARLVGSPAGYVGFEEGGQLTNHFQHHPYSLVLLDEIEKANPKIFDIFLQILDDGRLTSAKGDTINFTQGIIMATSNLGVQEILQTFLEGKDLNNESFTKEQLMPVLLKHFRAEFLNRFDAIIVYKPLQIEDLVQIALLEIEKIEARVKEHGITFSISPEVLRKKITTLYDPRFGARPVKRFVEEVCENLITKKLLN